ncbi:unnamed protein product [Leptidea sinapis]|uniref:Uncharacterized protein n=1 Tax=Leptidea sinapis TaxID=189913 RepID=A0A5E4Q9N6_9NEOP|nr:unnamed protein product [Leptidea sinapis]
MKAAAMTVWIFINLLCFGMCGYLYLIWSQYWMSIERQRLFTESQDKSHRRSSAFNYQEKYTDKHDDQLLNTTYSVQKHRRSVVALKTNMFQIFNKSNRSDPPTNKIIKSRGSPRFPNLHKPILEFDSEKYECQDILTTECQIQTKEFKELMIKEFHRMLMSDAKVFVSGLDSQNPYDVKYERKSMQNIEEIMCALKSVAFRTVTANDEPFLSLGYRIPKEPLLGERVFDTCAVVTSAGALLGSRFGLWFSLQRCNKVRVFEYVPSVRVTRRCHYYIPASDPSCTLGAWHPLAQEKLLAERMRQNSDIDVFQRGFIDINGFNTLRC